MKDKLPEAQIQERTQKLLELSRVQQKAWIESWQGKEVPVLIETITSEGVGKGYTPHYLRVQVPGCSQADHNTFLPVTITGALLEQEVALGTRL